MRFSLRTLLIGVGIICLALGIWQWREYLPGTLRFDQNGYAHGSGVTRYYYSSGALKTNESYLAGVLKQVTLYHPDGSKIATTRFDKEHGGVGIFVGEDGTVKMKVPCRFRASDGAFVAHGNALLYDKDGNVTKTVRYQDGVEIKE